MRILFILLAGLFLIEIGGCTKYTCKEEVQLDMPLDQARRRIVGLHLLAEERDRYEFGCYLVLNCGSGDWFPYAEPYKLTFIDDCLVRIEIDQDEKTRQEIDTNTNRSGIYMHQHFIWH
ncbi:MAG: hypothetical protein JXA82_06185 [Sedimentisphaerales bacterium]|nr:hypothetical protein [Sedimentisphaerales bacterium]